MNSPLTEFFKNAVLSVSPDGFFGIIVSLIVCGFIAAAIVSAKTNVNRRSMCIVFSLSCAALVTVFSAILLVAEVPIQIFAFYFASLAAVASVLTIVLSLIAVKNKETREEKELIRFIDDKIKNEAVSEPPIVKCEEDSIDKNESELPSSKDALIDFTHVKNVISRLNVYDISLAERRRIEELKEVLYTAEREGVTYKTKEKINDGLSYLLKIMSKYGV